MALTNSFYEAVKTGNVRRLRIMMEDSLLVDPSFQEFTSMESAAASVPGLYDSHDGKPFIMDQTEWTDEYMNKLKVQLISNFSHERINHLKDVIRVLRPVSNSNKIPNQQNAETSRRVLSYEEQKRLDQKNGVYQGTMIAAGAGAAAGAVVGAVLGGLTATIIEGEK